VLVIGGGTAGITVAARLRRAGVEDVGLVEPSDRHCYQPLWSLVGGGRAPVGQSIRPEASVVPRGVAWVKDAATDVDPDARVVTTAAGARVSYDHLVVCPGLQLDWDGVPGLPDALAAGPVTSNYDVRLAPRTWELVRTLRSGTAVFTMPSGPCKCGGAAQKIAYLACDWWRRQGVLDRIRVVLVLPGERVFGVPEFAGELERVVARYGIELRTSSELLAVHGDRRTAVVVDRTDGSTDEIGYDLLHVVPPQSAPDWLAATPLAAPGSGFVDVDARTLQHLRHADVFSLGDAASTPNAKTGAAVRKQAPVLVANLLAAMHGAEPVAAYDGYSSCPITTARDKVLLAEFDYSGRPHPTIPWVDTTRERHDMWLLKRYGLPFVYWHLMLRGLA
jgi:sulfide:quinone oxidoreductase